MRTNGKQRFAVNAATVGLILLSVLGCGSRGWKSRTHPVSGSVTINGAAPKDAIVKLIKLGEPIDTRQSDCWGVVQEDGSYVLTTYEPGDGAPEGDYAWMIRWPPNLMAYSSDRLGEQFWDPENPYMTVTIERGRNQIDPVELTNVEIKSLKTQPATMVVPQ